MQERPFRFFIAFMGVFVVAHAVLVMTNFISADTRQFVNLVLPIGAALFAGSCCSHVSAKKIGKRLRWSWRLGAVCCLVWALGQVTSSGAASTNYAVFTLLPITVVVLGRTALLASRTDARARFLVEGMTTVMALTLMTWSGLIVPNRSELATDLFGQAWTYLHIATNVLAAALVITGGLRTGRVRRLPGRTVVFLGIALGGYLLADGAAIFSTPTAGSMAWGWTLSFASLGIAALAPSTPRREEVRRSSYRYAYVVPSLGAAVALLAVIQQLGKGTRGTTSILLASAVVVLLVIREVMAALEEQRLRSILEGRIADRTQQLTRRERQFEALVRHSSDVIIILGDTGRFKYVSPSVKHVLGHSAEALNNAEVSRIVHGDDQARVAALLEMARRQQGTAVNAAWRVTRADGEHRQMEVLVRNLSDEPAVAGIVLNLRDVTERKDLEDQLTHQSLHDDLTGLANRALLRRHIERALSGWLFQNEPFSLIAIDLDDFKSINDSLGHVAGDLVLKALAERLAENTRHGDSIVRLNGDEFAILLEGVKATDPDAQAAVERIIAIVQEPMRIEGRLLTLRSSLGIACVTDQVSQADDILRNADLAMHNAKTHNRGGYSVFEVAMHDTALRRVEMEADLRRALANDGFVLHYQPTVDMKTGIVEGVEALIRWPHPEKGFVSPVDFIPIAEESGLIIPIGTWVLRQACNEMRKWQARYPGVAPLTLNVNLSGRQLDQPDIVDVVRNALDESGLAPGSLVLEMTESVLMDDNPSTLAKMEALVDLGVALAIDDFGTGYSSLSYLSRFPIQILKIDRYFVSGLDANVPQGDAALVQAILDIARTLELRTVAEGIETQEQMVQLRRMGCDIGQGFLLAKPQPAEEVRRLLEKTFAKALPVAACEGPEWAQPETSV